MNEKELFTKAEILEYLKDVIEYFKNLMPEDQQTTSYKNKLELLVRLGKQVESREFPVLTEDNGFCYAIQSTYAGLYLNLIPTKIRVQTLPQGEFSAPPFQLIRIKGEEVTIEQFAKLNNISENAVRMNLKAGYYVYAKRVGHSYQLPSLSLPIRDELLIGNFYAFKKPDDFTKENGDVIEFKENDRIQIKPISRDDQNRKRYFVKIAVFDLTTRKESDVREFVLGVKDKSKFIFHLIKAPGVQYWSGNIGLSNWMMS